jgi:hypothetical protein
MGRTPAALAFSITFSAIALTCRSERPDAMTKQSVTSVSLRTSSSTTS